MFRKITETFTATHLTVLVLGAMFIPGALYAIPSFTNVALEDANTGSRGAVTASRALYVYDGVAGYAGNPAYLVNIRDNSGPSTGVHTVYDIPSGKALLIKSITWSYHGNTEGTGTYLNLYDANLNILMDL